MDFLFIHFFFCKPSFLLRFNHKLLRGNGWWTCAFHVREGNRMKGREKVGGLFGLEMGVCRPRLSEKSQTKQHSVDFRGLQMSRPTGIMWRDWITRYVVLVNEVLMTKPCGGCSCGHFCWEASSWPPQTCPCVDEESYVWLTSHLC